jgi:hypothetical protein
MLEDAPLELVVESTDRTVLADVRVRQATRHDAADMRGFFEHDDFGAAPRSGNGCGDSGWIGGDNNDIRLLDRERGGESEKESE